MYISKKISLQMGGLKKKKKGCAIIFIVILLFMAFRFLGSCTGCTGCLCGSPSTVHIQRWPREDLILASLEKEGIQLQDTFFIFLI